MTSFLPGPSCGSPARTSLPRNVALEQSLFKDAEEGRDRLERLHRVAWKLTQGEWVGICTLADLAVASVLGNQHAAALSVTPMGITDLSFR